MGEITRSCRAARMRGVLIMLMATAIVASACVPPEPNPGPGGTQGLASWKELRPAAVGMGDGRLALFKTTAAGRLEYWVQEGAMTGTDGHQRTKWLPAQTIETGPLLASSPSVVRNADGTLTIVALGLDGVMYHLRQVAVDNAVPLSTWGSWAALPVLGHGLSFAGAPAATELDANDLRDVVVLGSDGDIYTTTQLASPVGAYAPWTKRYGASEGLAGSPGPVPFGASQQSEIFFVTSAGGLRTTNTTWPGTFADYGGSWQGSPTSFVTGSNRLSVAATTSSGELAVQQLAPVAPPRVVASGVHGSPASTRAGTATYVFAIRADGRVQFAPVANDGAAGSWYVIGQPAAPTPLSPTNGAGVYAPAEVDLEVAPVAGADEYRFELWEMQAGGGRTQIATNTSPDPRWTLPAGTLIAGRSYEWAARAWNEDSQLLSWYQNSTVVGSNAPAAPVRIAPEADSLQDPYGTIVLRARAVHAATAYRFVIEYGAWPHAQAWATTVESIASPGSEVSAVVPANQLPVGRSYRWSVTAHAGSVEGLASTPCCTTFLATTGVAGSSMMARTNTGRGYWMIHPLGEVRAFGDADVASGEQTVPLPGGAGWTTVGVVSQPRSTRGYWVLADSGAIYAYGGAPYLGGANGGTAITTEMYASGIRAVGMATTPSGNGYWILSSEGGIYAFGDAPWRGRIAYPAGSGEWATAIAPRPDGRGYWILSSWGGVASIPCGCDIPRPPDETPHYGSAVSGPGGGIPPVDRPAVGIQSTPTGNGYWIVSRVGGVYSFPPPNGPNPLPWHGGANTELGLNGNSAAGFSPASDGKGYWISQDWTGNPNDGAVFGLASAQYWGGMNVTLQPGQPTAPESGARFFPRTPGSTPTLQITAASGGAQPRYHFRISTDPAVSGEIVSESAWQPGLSWTPPAADLKDGRTYFWRVYTRDDDNSNSATVASSVSTFKVDKRYGTSGPSPVEEVGPVSVNLASGNLVAGWSSPQVNGAGLELTYNSLAPNETVQAGLPRGWTTSWGGDVSAQSLIAAGGTVTVVLVDGSKEAFTWQRGTGAGSYWLADDGSESQLTSTDAAGWVYTTPDGTTHDFDATGALVRTTLPLDQRKSAALRYTWSNTPIGRRMVAAEDPVSGRSMRFYFRGDGQDGCPTTPPGGAASAPHGLLCRIRLMDDRTYSFFYTTASAALAQPHRIVGSDGTTARFDWEYPTVSALGGQHSRLQAVSDVLANDAIAAGLRADDPSTRTEIRYQADGRADRVTRPAATAGSERQAVSITYSATGATVKRSGDAQPNGYSRQVETDVLGRATVERDQGARATTTAWRNDSDAKGDHVAYVQGPSGLRTGTQYDTQWKPVEEWGPAPSGWFATPSASNHWGAVPTAANQAATPRQRTFYDELPGSTTPRNGLALSFFEPVDLSGGVKRRSHHAGGASFDIGAAGWDSLPADGWSMRAEGLLVPTVKDNYTFSTMSDGGIRVFIDDRKVVDGWGLADGTARQSVSHGEPVELDPAKPPRIRVEFKDGSGNANWTLRWQRAGQAAVTIPTAELRPNYGLETRSIDADGNVSRTEFDDPSSGLASRTVQVVGGGQADLVSSATYEPEGTGWRRQTSRRLPSGAASQVDYVHYDDQAGPVPNSCGVTGTNQAGRPKHTTAADPDGAGPDRAIRRWYVYDDAGQTRGLLTTTADVSESALATQPWVCTAFDGRGRPTSVNHPAYGGAPARTVSYSYSNPLRVSATDPAGTVVTETDLLGQVRVYRDVHGNQTTRTYDVAGRNTGYSVLGATVTYAYQSDGLLDTVSVGGKVLADTTYEAVDGRLTSVAYPSGANALGNGTTGEFAYDTLMRSSVVTWKQPDGSLLGSENVTRSPGGNLRERWYDGDNLNGTNPDFTYDGAGRLTGAVVGSTSYAYQFGDAASCGLAGGAGKNSNRTAKTVAGATTTYCYDHADRLTSSSESTVGTVEYDARGNTTKIFGETHTYDIGDRHLSTMKGGTTVSYVRDLTDRIVERRVNGAAVARYGSTGGGDSPSLVTDMASGATEWTFALPGGALFTYKPAALSESTWSYPNLQGSVLATANHSGTKVGATRVWDPDGNNVDGGLPDNMPGAFDYGWLGQHQRPLEHEAGLSPIVEMGARQYSPILGRFLEVDPVEGGSANDYEYSDGDPLNKTDLDGLWPKCKWCKKAWKNTKKVAKATARHAAKNWRTYLAVGTAAACIAVSFGTCAGIVAAGFAARTAATLRSKGWNSRAGKSIFADGLLTLASLLPGTLFATAGGRAGRVSGAVNGIPPAMVDVILSRRRQ